MKGTWFLFKGLEPNLITRPQLLAGTGQTQPTSLSPRLQHQQFPQTATGTPHPQAGLQHPGVIHHQQITAVEFVLPVPDRPMPPLQGGRLQGRNHQQFCSMARLNRPLSDPSFRKLIVVGTQLKIPGISHTRI